VKVVLAGVEFAWAVSAASVAGLTPLTTFELPKSGPKFVPAGAVSVGVLTFVAFAPFD
jgi:hypothetical protein